MGSVGASYLMRLKPGMAVSRTGPASPVHRTIRSDSTLRDAFKPSFVKAWVALPIVTSFFSLSYHPKPA
jgi:hypothetical protein